MGVGCGTPLVSLGSLGYTNKFPPFRWPPLPFCPLVNELRGNVTALALLLGLVAPLQFPLSLCSFFILSYINFLLLYFILIPFGFLSLIQEGWFCLFPFGFLSFPLESSMKVALSRLFLSLFISLFFIGVPCCVSLYYLIIF
jgi:hypothetical protein